MTDINIKFGNRLKELRAKNKLTREALADPAGIDYKYVQMLGQMYLLNHLEKYLSLNYQNLPILLIFGDNM